MALSPQYQLAHLFLPNMVKLKGAATVVSALERKDLIFFDPLWQQAYVTHNPFVFTQTRPPFRIGIMTLPPPKDMGESYMAAIVVKVGEPAYARYFTLDMDYVLAKSAYRTLLCEREGQKQTKHREGPVLTGDNATDTFAFMDAVMAVCAPVGLPK